MTELNKGGKVDDKMAKTVLGQAAKVAKEYKEA